MNKIASSKVGIWIAVIIMCVSIGVIGYQFWRFINIPPQLSFDYNQAVSVGQEVRFTNTSTHINESATWSWDFGDKSPVQQSLSAVHKFPSVGTFIVTLTYKDQGVELQKKGAIIVQLPFPEASFEVNGNDFQVGQAISLTNTSKYAESFVWKLGNGQTSDESDPSVVYDKPGNYQLSLIAINEIGQLNEYALEIAVGSGNVLKTKISNDEVIVKHIAVFDESSLSKALTDLANNDIARSDKRKIRNDILKDVASLAIMINEVSLENYLNKIQLEASSKKVLIQVERIERNSNNKISEIRIN